MKTARTLTFAAICLSIALGGITCVQAGQKDIVSTAVEAGSFKTLAAALQAAGLVEALQGEGPFTVFAPTDKAFEKLPQGVVANLLKPENKDKLIGVLTYHVVEGNVPASQVVKLTGANTLNGQRVDIDTSEGVKVDNANVVKTDIGCTNGTIHVIDSVILPADKSIAETAKAAGMFNTLLAAADAAGLVEPLQGEGAITIFAPTDDAFKKLPADLLASLLKPENKEKLANILKYHVVDSRIYSPEAVEAGSAETLLGEPIRISVTSDGAKVNDSKLLKTDIDASNGVIHVIDTVLIPGQGGNAAAQPRHVIEEAIAKGSELFNNGHAGQCSEVYKTTMNNLLAHHSGAMPTEAGQAMELALEKAEHCGCMNSQAWALRRGLEKAYHAMQPSVDTTAAVQ